MSPSAQISRMKSTISGRAAASAPRAVPLDAPKRKDAKNSASAQLQSAKPANETKARGSSTQLMAADETRRTLGTLSDVKNRLRVDRGGASLARARRAYGSSSSSSSLVSPPATKTTASLKFDSKTMARDGVTGKAQAAKSAKDSSRRKKFASKVLSAAEAAVTQAAKLLGIDAENLDWDAVKAHHAYETDPRLAVEQTMALSQTLAKFGVPFKKSSHGPPSQSLSSLASPQRASQEVTRREATPTPHEHAIKHSMSSIKTFPAPEHPNSTAPQCDEVGPPLEVPPHVPSPQQQQAPYYPCDRVPPQPDMASGKDSPTVSRSPNSVFGFSDDRTTFAPLPLLINNPTAPAAAGASCSSDLGFSSVPPLASLMECSEVNCNKPVLDATFCEAPCGEELQTSLIMKGIADVLTDEYDDVNPETHRPSPWMFAVHISP